MNWVGCTPHHKMIIGAAQIDVTPPFAPAEPIELSGYAARVQPAVGVLDPIFVRAIFLQDGDQRLLWLAADVIALPAAFVTSFRDWGDEELRLTPGQVLLCATHTHAAPATISLTGCGACSDAFISRLRDGMQRVARDAMARTEPCGVKFVQRELALAIDRRGMASAHVDPIVTALGFCRADGSFIAACLNYAMHPVALSHENRHISADWPGYASAALRDALPGKPMVMVSNGACGNINPPFQTTHVEEVRALGEQVEQAVARPLIGVKASDENLRLAYRTVPLPLETLSPPEIDAAADDAARDGGNLESNWQRALNAAIDTWRQSARFAPRHIPIDLLATRIGPITMLAINGEMFSRFTAIVRRKINAPLFVVAYANAAFGYIPTREAYAEGGYEVERAHFFYNSPRPRIGGLEMLADHAAELIATLRSR
jgi:neutral ceramidase